MCVQNDIHEDLIHLIVDSKFVRIQCDCFDLSLNLDHYCSSIKDGLVYNRKSK